MTLARNVVYSYVDRTRSVELEVDLTNELSFKIGDILTRNGRILKVASIHLSSTDGGYAGVLIPGTPLRFGFFSWTRP